MQFERSHAVSIERTLILKADAQPASLLGSQLQSSCGGLT